jgi:hypothetical protein
MGVDNSLPSNGRSTTLFPMDFRGNSHNIHCTAIYTNPEIQIYVRRKESEYLNI